MICFQSSFHDELAKAQQGCGMSQKHKPVTPSGRKQTLNVAEYEGEN